MTLPSSSSLSDAAPGPDRQWSAVPERTLCVVPDRARRVSIFERHVKRPMDLVGGVALVVVLSPLLAVTALAVRLRLGSPVFFHQTRIGRDGEEFEVIKFRSMGLDRRQVQDTFDGRDRRRVHKTSDDPRHTALGRRIRQLSLDELPQLVNVVKGQMSLVGPRPELAHVAREHQLVDHPRHVVRPGMTGLWQVSTDRKGLLHENVDKDLDYIEHITFTGDVRILFRTLGAIGRANGS